MEFFERAFFRSEEVAFFVVAFRRGAWLPFSERHCFLFGVVSFLAWLAFRCGLPFGVVSFFGVVGFSAWLPFGVVYLLEGFAFRRRVLFSFRSGCLLVWFAFRRRVLFSFRSG